MENHEGTNSESLGQPPAEVDHQPAKRVKKQPVEHRAGKP
jgi:hypothetical protein